MLYTRRELATLALAALPAARCSTSSVSAFQAKPNSKVRGRHNRHERPLQLRRPQHARGRDHPELRQLGVSGVELRTQPVEAFLGVPAIS